MHYRPNREPLIGSLALMISSSLISAFAQEMGQTNGLWAIMVSRILLGMTRGNVFCTWTQAFALCNLKAKKDLR